MKEYTEAVANFLKDKVVNSAQEETDKKTGQEAETVKVEVDENENENDKGSEYYEKFSDFDFDDNE